MSHEAQPPYQHSPLTKSVRPEHVPLIKEKYPEPEIPQRRRHRQRLTTGDLVVQTQTIAGFGLEWRAERDSN